MRGNFTAFAPGYNLAFVSQSMDYQAKGLVFYQIMVNQFWHALTMLNEHFRGFAAEHDTTSI